MIFYLISSYSAVGKGSGFLSSKIAASSLGVTNLIFAPFATRSWIWSMIAFNPRPSPIRGCPGAAILKSFHTPPECVTNP